MTTTTDIAPNRMQLQLQQVDEFPRLLRPWVRNLVLRRAVPFTRTARVEFVEMSPSRVEVRLGNEPRVRNHIGGIHASAMNLLAETATGMAVGLNVRDDCLPLAKDMKMAFRKRATGALRAVAVLTDAPRGHAGERQGRDAGAGHRDGRGRRGAGGVRIHVGLGALQPPRKVSAARPPNPPTRLTD